MSHCDSYSLHSMMAFSLCLVPQQSAVDQWIHALKLKSDVHNAVLATVHQRKWLLKDIDELQALSAEDIDELLADVSTTLDPEPLPRGQQANFRKALQQLGAGTYVVKLPTCVCCL